MHELSIANAILKTIEAECRARGGLRPRRAGLRIGELSSVNAESLRFALTAATRDTPFAELELAIESCSPRRLCRACGAHYVGGLLSACPRCACSSADLLGGDELEITYLEVEDETCRT